MARSLGQIVGHLTFIFIDIILCQEVKRKNLPIMQ